MTNLPLVRRLPGQEWCAWDFHYADPNQFTTTSQGYHSYCNPCRKVRRNSPIHKEVNAESSRRCGIKREARGMNQPPPAFEAPNNQATARARLLAQGMTEEELGIAYPRWMAYALESGVFVMGAGGLLVPNPNVFEIQFMRRFYKRPTDGSTRFSVDLKEELWLEQDGRCCYCPKDLPWSTDGCQGEHIRPWSLEGPTTKNNGAISCKACNRDKGSWDPRLWFFLRPSRLERFIEVRGGFEAPWFVEMIGLYLPPMEILVP